MTPEQGASAELVALTTRLQVVRSERDQEASARAAAVAEVERLQELVVGLQVRLAALESATPATSRRGLASLITPPQEQRGA